MNRAQRKQMARHLAQQKGAGRFQDAMRTMIQQGAEVQQEQASAYLKEQAERGNKFDFGALRAADQLRFATRAPVSRTPYPMNVIRHPEEGWDFAIGTVDRLNQRHLDKKVRAFRWTLEVTIFLSDQARNRVFSALLFPPHMLQVDSSSLRSVSDHRMHMKAREQYNARVAMKAQGLLEEDQRIDNGTIPPRGRDKNFTVDGMMRLLRDMCDGAGGLVSREYGAPAGDPMIRVMLETSYGVILSRSSMDRAGPRDLLLSWIHDIIEFTSGDGRDRYWDAAQEMFVMIPDQKAKKPAPTPMAAIWASHRK
jgi:hypothetical protein